MRDNYEKRIYNQFMEVMRIPDAVEEDLRKDKNKQKMEDGFRKESGNKMSCSIMTIIEPFKKREPRIIEYIKKLWC